MRLAAVLVLLRLTFAAPNPKGATLTQLDPGPGCAASNTLAMVGVGLVAGVFAGILPCLIVFLLAQQRWANDFLDASNSSFRRVTASIKDKWSIKGYGQNGGESYGVTIEFEAARDDGTNTAVTGKIYIQPRLFTLLSIGSLADVAYRVGNETEFAIIKNLEEFAQTENHHVQCAFSVP